MMAAKNQDRNLNKAMADKTAALLQGQLAQTVTHLDPLTVAAVRQCLVQTYARYYSDLMNGAPEDVSETAAIELRQVYVADALSHMGYALHKLYQDEVEPVCRDYFGPAFGSRERMLGRIAMNEDGMTPDLARALAYADGIAAALGTFETLAVLEGGMQEAFHRHGGVALPELTTLQSVAQAREGYLDLILTQQSAGVAVASTEPSSDAPRVLH